MTEIEQVLGPGGLLSRSAPGYEHRPQQLAMAAAVLRVLEGKGYTIVEAGTGTGKTLAYLVPALLSGRKVVISTATRTLQDQIFFKDIPLLSRALNLDVRAAYMKGRSNYLCKARHDEFRRAPAFVTREEARFAAEIERWAEVTESGDRAELGLPDAFATWRDLSSTSETCTGTRCARFEECFVTRMRRQAADADVVVVNHHLYFADLALRGAEGGGEVIPRHDAVVFDEAHALEEIATDYFGVQVSNWRFEELVRDATRAAARAPSLAPVLAAPIAAVEGRAAGFFSALEELTGLVRGRTRGEGGDSVLRLARGQLAPLAQEHAELDRALEELGVAADNVPEVPELEAIARRCGSLRDDSAFAAEPGGSADFVFFAERRGKGLFLRAAPIEIGEEMARRLYARIDTAVFTSATLAVGGSFDYVRRRLGLAGAAEREALPVAELQVGSPFDYRTQAALYLPTHLPEPQDPLFVERAAQELEELLPITGGRAFVLFTSVRNMEKAHARLSPVLPWQVLLQGELPKAQLLERFQQEPSVLFATSSFWEGVDVPGDALSMVVIDKLPFAAPNDPIVAARIEALRAREVDAFATYQVPQAAIALRQGFGRLIRTRADRGIVAVLDRRIVTRSYGMRFVRSLPGCPRFGKLADVARWWSAVSPAVPR